MLAVVAGEFCQNDTQNHLTSTHKEDLESYAKNKIPTRWSVNFVYKQIGLTVQQCRRVKVNPKLFCLGPVAI